MTTDQPTADAPVPQGCTLPAVEQPLRVAEFDQLLATALRAQQRPAPTVLRWTLDPAVEDRARDLAARETRCCAFFAFDLTSAGEGLQVDVRVPAAHVDVLDALAARAATAAGIPA